LGFSKNTKKGPKKKGKKENKNPKVSKKSK